MNKKRLLEHRRMVYEDSMQVLIDKVSGKRSKYNLDKTLEHEIYRAEKLLKTNK